MNRLIPILCIALATTGCRRDMFNQPRYKTYAADAFFADGASARPLPPHVVPRGAANLDTEYFTGKTDDGKLLESFPAPVTQEMLERGHQRFEIYCSVCHGSTGEGNGMIVQRGFPAPPSLHIDRLRDAPPGYIFDVITNGHGVMYSYASRVDVPDRWAVAAYIRALQLSRHAKLDDVPPDERTKLQAP